MDDSIIFRTEPQVYGAIVVMHYCNKCKFGWEGGRHSQPASNGNDNHSKSQFVIHNKSHDWRLLQLLIPQQHTFPQRQQSTKISPKVNLCDWWVILKESHEWRYPRSPMNKDIPTPNHSSLISSSLLVHNFSLWTTTSSYLSTCGVVWSQP